MKTTPPSISDEGTQCPGSNPHHMAPGKACHPVSPGFRRGLLVPFTRAKSRASSEERATSKGASRGNADGLGWSDADSLIWRFGLPGSRAGVAAAASEMCESRPRHFAWFSQASGRRRRPGLRSRPAGYPWAKPSMAFAHLADRWKRRGFPRSAFLASCSGRLVPQSASEMAMDGISRRSRHFAWFYQASGRRRRPGLRSRPPSEMAMDGISRRSRHFAWFYQAKCAKALFASAMR
jgi:hypothetical protein